MSGQALASPKTPAAMIAPNAIESPTAATSPSITAPTAKFYKKEYYDESIKITKISNIQTPRSTPQGTTLLSTQPRKRIKLFLRVPTTTPQESTTMSSTPKTRARASKGKGDATVSDPPEESTTMSSIPKTRVRSPKGKRAPTVSTSQQESDSDTTSFTPKKRAKSLKGKLPATVPTSAKKSMSTGRVAFGPPRTPLQPVGAPPQIWTPSKQESITTIFPVFNSATSKSALPSPVVKKGSHLLGTPHHSSPPQSKGNIQTTSTSTAPLLVVTKVPQIPSNTPKSGSQQHINTLDSANQDYQFLHDDGDSGVNFADDEKNYLAMSKALRKANQKMPRNGKLSKPARRTDIKEPPRWKWESSEEYGAQSRGKMSLQHAFLQYSARTKLQRQASNTKKPLRHKRTYNPEVSQSNAGIHNEVPTEEGDHRKKRAKNGNEATSDRQASTDPVNKADHEADQRQPAHITSVNTDPPRHTDPASRLQEENLRLQRLFEQSVEETERQQDELEREREAICHFFNPSVISQPQPVSESSRNIDTGLKGDIASGDNTAAKSPSAEHTPEEKKKKPSLSDPHSRIVWVTIKDTTFAIYRDFLDYHCPSLVPAGQGTTRFIPYKPLQLQDIDVKVFALLVRWLYLQVVTRENGKPEYQHRLMELWVLAQRLNMPQLQNGSIDGIEWRRGDGEQMQTKSHHWIYANTPKGAALRRYLVDVCADAIREWVDDVVLDQFPAEMLAEMAERGEGADVGEGMDMERYHVVVDDA